MNKVFHDLPPKEQDDIRRQYKQECSKSYKYSIHLFILNVILGIISVIGLFLTFFAFLLGMLIFTISFILLIIVVYFLNLSNQNFLNYLKKHHIKYN